MAASDSLPPLHLQTTLKCPTGLTRAWSSRPHPSSKSPLLATASSDRTVQVWDLRDFKLVSTITGGHKRSVRCVGWKDWGQADSGPGGTAHRRQASDVEWEDAAKPKKEDRVTLATGSFDANVGVWIYDPSSTRREPDLDEIDVGASEEREDWNFSALLTGPDSEIKDLEFSPPNYSANFLATCSRDKSVWVWEEVDNDNEWETVAVLGDHTGDVKCVAWCTGASAPVEGQQMAVGCREVLATGSYDDTIRLWRDVEEEGDWMCVGAVHDHKGTVWDLCWEGFFNMPLWQAEVDVREWEPRLVSCSDDLSVRIWRRELDEGERQKKRERARSQAGAETAARLPSVIRPAPTMERWTEDSKLPDVHVRSIYAVDWSRTTGLIVSCGGDGTIAVYKEVHDDVVMNGTAESDRHLDAGKAHDREDGRKESRWIVVAVIDAAHEEYEVNHVCWAARRDPGKRWSNEETIVSTGDDGNVRIWTVPEDIIDTSWRT